MEIEFKKLRSLNPLIQNITRQEEKILLKWRNLDVPVSMHLNTFNLIKKEILAQAKKV